MELRGIVAAITTPFGPAGEVWTDRLTANLERYNAAPLSGYLVLGSSGEAICLDRDEKLAVLRAAARAAAPGKLLLAGTAEESLRGTLEMTVRAAELGYHVAVVRTPHYYKKAMTQAAFAAYYRAVAAASPIPIMIYNIPPLTGVDVTVETTLELASRPNIVGLKESSGNMDKLVRIATGAPPGFGVMVGGASTLYPSLCAGAAGAILALAAAAPEACCAVERAWRAGDHGAALAAQRRLLLPAATMEAHAIAGLKAAVESGGGYGGDPRLPQLPLTAAQREIISAAFAPLQVDCSVPA